MVLLVALAFSHLSLNTLHRNHLRIRSPLFVYHPLSIPYYLLLVTRITHKFDPFPNLNKIGQQVVVAVGVVLEVFPSDSYLQTQVLLDLSNMLKHHILQRIVVVVAAAAITKITKTAMPAYPSNHSMISRHPCPKSQW